MSQLTYVKNDEMFVASTSCLDLAQALPVALQSEMLQRLLA
jgi:hypothetical protein